MTPRQRLLASLQGQPVDRPAVNFYEIGGYYVDPHNPDPFNIYNDPSWQPLLELAEEHTDLIRKRTPRVTFRHPEVRAQFFRDERINEPASRWHNTYVTIAGRELTQRERREPTVNTTWTIEHLLKSEEDVQAFLQIPDEAFVVDLDYSPILNEDRLLGERGLVMIDTPDPLCQAASLLSMEDYTVLALTNPSLFHALLEKMARPLYANIQTLTQRCSGHLWRIYGPEYAAEPYLPSRLFAEYVVRYVTPIIDAIHATGGFARIHCYGRIRQNLPHIIRMNADAIDPIEPPPQGDIQLLEVRQQYGAQLTLFGNLEACDIENLEPAAFEARVAQALREGTAGSGRGFVLLPSACPFGRTITPRTLANYQTMIRLVQQG